MPTFQDYIEYIKSGQQYLEEASYNNIDITDLNHDSVLEICPNLMHDKYE